MFTDKRASIKSYKKFSKLWNNRDESAQGWIHLQGGPRGKMRQTQCCLAQSSQNQTHFSTGLFSTVDSLTYTKSKY